MVENRPFLTFLSHLVVIVGLLIIAFPVWMTFVASTHDQETMLRSPVPLWPGTYLFENYWTVLTEGYRQSPRHRAALHHAHQQHDHGAGRRDREDR